MTSLYLDMTGRLHWFVGVPPQREPPVVANVAPDWSVLFQEAGLDLASFQAVASTSVPLHAYDTRVAWEGTDTTHPELKTHVEAAAFRGKVVYFETIYPWDQPVRQEQATESGRDRALSFILIAVYIIVLVASALLARRNLKLGRGDRRGAARLGALFLILNLLYWLFMKHHNGVAWPEFALFILAVSGALYNGFFLWLLYLAFEPYVRKRWPHRIVAWSRLVAGGYRDPLVGRDILIGAVCGVGMFLCTQGSAIGLRWIGKPPTLLLNPGNSKIGTNLFMEKFSTQMTAGVFLAFISLLLLLLFVMVVRREWLAFVLLWLLQAVLNTLIADVTLPMIFFPALSAFLVTFALYRYGLLAAVSALFFLHFELFFPITTEFTAWYATDFLIALVICLAIAVYAFYISLAGQPLFAGELLED
jgi:serine/threonine-protein kinase